MSAPDYAKYTLDEVKKALAGLDEDADYEKIKKLEAQKMFLRVERHSQMTCATHKKFSAFRNRRPSAATKARRAKVARAKDRKDQAKID